MISHHQVAVITSLICFVLKWNFISSVADCSELDIDPCTCTTDEQNAETKTTISCRDTISLPRLTTILREELCDRHIYSFRLDASNISYLPSNLFFKVRVENIRIDSTNISHFTEAGRSSFFGLERSLQTLIMRRCHLVDQLRWEKIGALNALFLLDLSENDLTTVPNQWFEHPPIGLKFLYLRANKMKYIGESAFTSMYNLEYIDLSENQISTLQRNSFPFPGNSIIFLSLSYNQLTSLPKNFFNEMYGLRRIYLDHNHFSTLDEDTWTPIWGELAVLDLMGNELKCHCDMAWMSRLYKIEHLYGKCSNHPTLSNRELKTLWPWDFNCSFASHETENGRFSEIS